MTTFDAPHNHRTLTIGQHADGSGITFHAEDGSASVGVYLDPADAPAIALAVLKSAGHASQVFDATAVQCAVGNLERHMDDAAAAAEEAARDKRRDELALKFTGQSIANFDEGWVVDLIDRIIDTENELAKERAK